MIFFKICQSELNFILVMLEYLAFPCHRLSEKIINSICLICLYGIAYLECMCKSRKTFSLQHSFVLFVTSIAFRFY